MRLRYRATALVAALGIASLGGNCDDLEDEDTSMIVRQTDAGSSSEGGSECAPAAQCSVVAASEPGAECMAKRDNRNQERIQLRQVWSRNVKPAGLANNPLLAPVLVQASELKFGQSCNDLSTANGGYNLLLDWDRSDPIITNQTSRLGYADFVPGADGAAAVRDGLCMVRFRYHARGADTPTSRAKIGEEIWNVEPAVNERRDRDFTLEEVRGTIPEGQGVFYYDERTQVVHGYSPTTYVVVNVDDKNPAALIAVPIRHAELTIRGNDASNNCAGRHRADRLNQQTCQPVQSVTDPAWGCKAEDEASGKCQAGDGATFVKGYFRIIDLERVLTVFNETLCVAYSGQKAEERGWVEGSKKYCSLSPDWGKDTPNDPLRGGDYCSLTHEDGGCRDSWKTEVYMVLQAFPIRNDVCVPKQQEGL